jgi:peroxiredoxin
VDFWLIDVQDTFEASLLWTGQAGVTLPVLLDLENTVYGSYSRSEVGDSYSPFPLHVVIDGSGVITYLSADNQPEQVRDAVSTALEKL